MDQGAAALLTVAETADRLGLPRMVVYRLIHSGDLPAVGMGHSLRVPVAALATAPVRAPRTPGMTPQGAEPAVR